VKPYTLSAADEVRIEKRSAGWVSGEKKRMKRALPTGKLLPLDQLSALPDARESGHSGVYFLWFCPELVYIGKAENVGKRVKRHDIRKGRNRATFQKVHVFHNQRVEAMYCRHYTPRMNLTRWG
jgi:hypothetical protein